MTLRLIILACALRAISACVVDPYPYGGRGYYGNGYYSEDYGHRVWR
jgi:hypothetical protein